MNIPVSPIPVRISLETQAINNGGSVVHDIDVKALLENANSAQYELQLCYDTTSLYRSSVYHINKNYKTISFFFMVGQDMFIATLTAANNRCSFQKMSAGISESEVRQIVTETANSGFSQNLLQVSDGDGCTLTMPYTNKDISASGHIYIHTASDDYDSDFVYTTSGFKLAKGRNSSVLGGIVLSDLTDTSVTPNVKTGLYIQDDSFETLDVFVTWYYNPEGCYLEEGRFIPGSGE